MLKILVCILIIILFPLPCGCQADDSALTLKKYPQIFSETTVVITDNQSSPIDIEIAAIIADNLKKETGYESRIIDIGDITDVDKVKNNLVIISTPDSSTSIAELLDKAGVSPITGVYPGENKGILEIAVNLWNTEKAVLIVGGSDMWGLKAAVLMLEDLKLSRVSQKTVDWEDYTGVRFPIDSKSEAIRYARLDHDVRGYIDWLREDDIGVSFWASQSSDSLIWAVGISAKGFGDAWMEIHFLPDGMVISKGKGAV